MDESPEPPDPDPDPQPGPPPPAPPTRPGRPIAAFWLVAFLASAPIASQADGLDRARAAGRLAFGADEEGGAPYFWIDAASGRRVGFEAEIMDRVAGSLGVAPDFRQVQWDYLLPVLGRPDSAIDLVINGYELTEARARDYRASRPYYVYQLQLMARRDGPARSWADFALPRPGGGPWRVGVLGLSAGDAYARRFEDANLRVVTFDGATTAMTAVRNGQIDATLQDLPAARYYARRPEFADLALVGPPEGSGYYVLYARRSDARLIEAVDAALGRMIESGELRSICERYGIWNDAQAALAARPRAEPAADSPRRPRFDVALIGRFGPDLALAAGVTAALACASMPLAMAIGLVVALGRVYGPAWLAYGLGWYVEIVRGTPLIIQLYALFYVLPDVGIALSPWAAGLAGLAINYSAYEAEVYRSGLQAIPKGQMEAALALGMSHGMALRRVVVPQAVRLVIPAVASDFIALFKDTSVCSVITLIELTKRYSILFNSQGAALEFGLATAALYLAMSLPLSMLARALERRIDRDAAGPGGAER